MPSYTPPLRDMQFVMHEVFKVTDDFKAMPKHADIDVDTINAVDLIKALDRSAAGDAIDASTGEGIVAREVVRQFNLG